MSQYRKCTRCGKSKSEDCFGKAKTCLECSKKHKEACKKYEKTPKGFLMRLYRNMKSRVEGIQKIKFHLYKGKSILNKDEFYIWATGSSKFKLLFKDYEDSNYDRKLAPSVDRINSDKGYNLNNMEFVTMSENSRRGSLSRWNGK